MSSNRIALLAAAVGGAVVIVVVLIVVGSGGGKKAAVTTTGTTTTSTAPATGVSALPRLPQHGDTLGNPNAPVTLTVYEDPQCPFCRQWNIDTLPTVITHYIAPGRLKVVYRGVEIIGPNSEPGLRAIYAAARQNKLWTLVEELYLRQGTENSGWITHAMLRSAARAAGANAAAVLAGLNSKAVDAALTQAETDATAINLRGTPTFVIERPPALPTQLSVTGLDPSSFIPALDAALQ